MDSEICGENHILGRNIKSNPKKNILRNNTKRFETWHIFSASMYVATYRSVFLKLDFMLHNFPGI